MNPNTWTDAEHFCNYRLKFQLHPSMTKAKYVQAIGRFSMGGMLNHALSTAEVKAKLWDELKDSALADALRPSVSQIQTGTDKYNRMERDAAQAQRLYDRMIQAETLAMVTKIVAPSTMGPT